MVRSTFVLAIGCLLASWSFGAADCRAAADNAAVEKADIEAVKKFLAAKHEGMTWGSGPTRLQSAVIDAAYADVRFYYVFSPQYPVAREGQISLMMRIDKDGKVAELSAPKDYGVGLMKIANADDAKTAAAAVMSLLFGPFGPFAVDAKMVEAKPDGKGWLCTANVGKAGKMRQSRTYRVAFDAQGACTEAIQEFAGPLPICIGGLFLPVAAPAGVAGLTREIGGALETASVEAESIADRAGLRPGDIIISFAGRPLPHDDVIQQMRQIVYPLKQQSAAARTVGILRDGEAIELTLRWDENDAK